MAASLLDLDKIIWSEAPVIVNYTNYVHYSQRTKTASMMSEA